MSETAGSSSCSGGRRAQDCRGTSHSKEISLLNLLGLEPKMGHWYIVNKFSCKISDSF